MLPRTRSCGEAAAEDSEGEKRALACPDTAVPHVMLGAHRPPCPSTSHSMALRKRPRGKNESCSHALPHTWLRMGGSICDNEHEQGLCDGSSSLSTLCAHAPKPSMPFEEPESKRGAVMWPKVFLTATPCRLPSLLARTKSFVGEGLLRMSSLQQITCL